MCMQIMAKVVRGPYCWQEIDIEDWSRYLRPESLDRMLLLLIGRSCGSLRKLSVYGLASEMSLSLIADHAKNLHNLRLPGSEITDPMVQQVAPKLSSITSLDLSYCTKIGAPTLEAIGNNCKNLIYFQHNMHPWDVAERMSQDDEAYAISSTMSQLKHLELAYLNVTTDGVLHIIRNCHLLELLDIRGCWNVKLDEAVLKERSELEVVGPLVVECYDKGKKRYDFYPASASCWAWGFSKMDEYDDEEDVCDMSSDIWGEVQDIEDLGLMSYDDLDMMYEYI
ncbi:F-box protein FBW2 [Bienertia sinuspersici]